MLPQISLGYFSVWIYISCVLSEVSSRGFFTVCASVRSGFWEEVSNTLHEVTKKHQKGENPAVSGNVPTEAGATPVELSCELLVNLRALRAWASGAGPGCLPPRCVSEPALERFRTLSGGIMLVLSLQVSWPGLNFSNNSCSSALQEKKGQFVQIPL